MKTPPAEKNINVRCAVKGASALRKEAETRGVPSFALRLAASQRVRVTEADTTLRYRRD